MSDLNKIKIDLQKSLSYLSKYTVFLTARRSEREKGKAVGTGFCVTISGYYFVVTAKHVLDSVDRSFHSLGMYDGTSNEKELFLFTVEKLDLAIFQVKSNNINSANYYKINKYQLLRMNTHVAYGFKMHFMIVGYPIRGFNNRSRKLSTYYISTESRASIKEKYQVSMKRSGINYMKLNNKEEKEVEKIFIPKGMSGSPIFYLGSDIDLQSNIISPALGGVFTEISKDGKQYIGTNSFYLISALKNICENI